MWDEVYNRLVELIEQHRSTLVFVNTRRLAERIAHNLGERLGEDNVAAHHGSLSRKLRLSAEQKLKEGKVKVLVATASLELGIDIGTVDLVVQISSPRAIAVALQRVGRSGHWRGAIPEGALLRRHARRSAGMCGAGAGHPAGRSGPADHSRRAVGHSGAADCGRLRGGKQHCKSGAPPGSRISLGRVRRRPGGNDRRHAGADARANPSEMAAGTKMNSSRW